MDRPGAHALTPVIPDVEVLEVIGRGGSGAVYRGHQAALGRDVAVKVVSAPGAPEASVERWRREVSAMGRLSNHPNIVAVYAGGLTEDGSPYLVMPYVPGGSVHDRLQAEGPLPAADVATLGAKLAGALATAHAAGVLHRDVKPENVLLSPYGEPQLSDFGIARLVDSSTTAASGIWATIPYAPPEVLNGQPASEAADVYGLGATLHACLTGAAPFSAGPDETLVSLVARVMTAEPPPLAALGVPAPLAAVVERAMAKDPERRQVSAAALRRDLEGVASLLARQDPTSSEGAAEATTVVAPAPAEPPPVAPAASPVAVAPPPGAVLPSAAGSTPPPLSPASPSSAGPPIQRPPAHPGGSRSRVGLAAAVVAVVGVLVLVAVLIVRGDGDDGPQGTAMTPSTSDAPTTTAPPPSTTPSTTAPTATTTTPTTTVPPTAEAVAPDLATAATTYLDAVGAGDLDRAWTLTSSRFRQVQDRSGWAAFWSGIDEVEVVGEPRVSVADAAVVVPLLVDGQREDYRMTFVQEGGGWRVDGPTSR
jgi:serine/threonine-protein kinase PknK